MESNEERGAHFRWMNSSFSLNSLLSQKIRKRLLKEKKTIFKSQPIVIELLNAETMFSNASPSKSILKKSNRF